MSDALRKGNGMTERSYAPTTVNEYFSYLEKTVSEDTPLYRAAHAYLESERAAHAPSDGPFLSVVTRTQGRRPGMLAEMLASLEKQTDRDFELLIMGHNLDKEQRSVVEGILRELSSDLGARTRFVPVDGGNRTTPLNRGFEEARGRYIAVLDDDDLVLARWVAAFHELSREHDGKILHAYTDLQEWQTVDGETRPASAASSIFHCDFRLLEQLSSNACPLCALAFPAVAFRQLGIRFDERLTTTEDWDFLMRTAFLTGVANTSEVTFLYRKWLDAENSFTVHKKAEWDANYRYIVERFVRTPIVFPAGSLHGVIDKGVGSTASALALREMEVFHQNADGFAAARIWRAKEACDREEYTALFAPDTPTEVTALRFDPRYYGYLTLEELRFLLVAEDGTEQEYGLSDVSTNGRTLEGRIVFLFDDPQIVLTLKAPVRLSRFYLHCRMRERVSNEDITAVMDDYAVANRPRSLPYRVLRRIWRALKKMFKQA